MRWVPLSLIVLLAPIAAATGGASAAADGGIDGVMQAVVVSAGRIQLREVPRPVAGSGQVLVKLHYAAVNPGDWKTPGLSDDPAAGPTAIDPAATPSIPGVDGAGVIVAVGAGVAGYHVGDAVIVWSRARGTYAQYVAVSADTITRKPDRLSFAEAAGVAHAALAAWNLLLDHARLRAGQTLLVLGGAGGVGSAAVQIGRIKGARVIATASARNAGYLQRLGASTVIDYSAQHFEDQLRAIDVALDTVDLDNAYRALAVIKRGGQLVSTVGLPSPTQCAARSVTCQGRTLTGSPPRAVLRQIASWSQSGLFTVNIDRTFELSEIAEAWQYSQAGHTRGKLVIRIGDQD